MDFLKDLFNNGALTLEQFSAAAQQKGFKLADIAKGEYVSKKKYDDDITARDTQITTLNGTISTRDADLETVRKQLQEAGVDKEKLDKALGDLSTMQTKYKTDTENYEKKLKQQTYEFAVKEFAGTKKFTSNAAKRDFINSMIAKSLQIDGDKIIGAEDFVASYAAENGDAFVAEKQAEQQTTSNQYGFVPPPQFAQTTPGNASSKGTENPFNFNFTGVRSKSENK